MKDYYKILDIEFEADLIAIKKAYRKLAFQYHPDKSNSQDATQKFIEITEAYEVLCDFTKRAEYDKMYNSYQTQDKSSTDSIYEEIFREKQKEWAEYGREKAREYASIPFSEFAKKIYKEFKLGASYIPNIIAMLFTAVGAMGTLVVMAEEFADDEFGFAILLLFMSVGLAYLTYRLYVVAYNDYIEDRKQK